jgi:hypothetical protein
MSVQVIDPINDPLIDPPQRATVSASRQPGHAGLPDPPAAPFLNSQLIVFIPFFRGVIYYESTNPFCLRPVGHYGVF